MIRILLIASTTAMLATTAVANPHVDAIEREVRIATWDLHDLWHVPGKALRHGARPLNAADIKALRHRATRLRADVFALQGVGSKRAIHKLFPARDYFVIFSRELSIRMHLDRDILSNPTRRRVYTAFVIRRSGKVRLLAREHVLELADPSPQLGDGRPQGQSGLAIRLRIHQQPIWILNARLLPGCNRTQSSDRSEEAVKQQKNACTARNDQIDLINHWKGTKQARTEPVVIALALPKVSTTRTREASRNNLVITNATYETWSRLLARGKTIPKPEQDERYGATRFALTNQTTAASNRRASSVTQPNTVALTGPTRRPGKRLVPAKKKNVQEDGISDLIITALTEYAKTKRAPQKKPPPSKPKATPPEEIPGKKVDTQKPKTLDNTHFMRHPSNPIGSGCTRNPLGENFLIISQNLMEIGKKIRLLIDKPTSQTPGTTPPDCIVYIDIFSRKF